MKTLEGNVIGKGLKVGIVAARFNEFIVNKLIGGAEDALVRHGVDTKDVELAYVPGAFEIPIVAQKMAASGKYDVVICLGAVIKGSTSHYDYVCAEVSKGVAILPESFSHSLVFLPLTYQKLCPSIVRTLFSIYPVLSPVRPVRSRSSFGNFPLLFSCKFLTLSSINPFISYYHP